MTVETDSNPTWSSESGSLAIAPMGGPVSAQPQIPGSKSHTNRALVCAGLASGRSTLDNVLFAADTAVMMDAIQSLGATIEEDKPARRVTVDGIGAGAARSADLHVGQSGTTSRFLLPVLASLPGTFVLDGDDQLRGRPFGPQLSALSALGARIDGDGLPLRIRGRRLAGGSVTIDGAASSQFLSGLLLAGPLMSGPLRITVGGHLVSRPYVDLTRSTMSQFGVGVGVGGSSDFETRPAGYQGAAVTIEPDASAASYFFAAAALCGGTVTVEGLDSSTVQGDLAFVGALDRMGASVSSGRGWTSVTGTGELHGIDIDMRDLSDTAQTLAVVAAHADSPTEITGIGFIRRKETDRIGAVVTELNRLGIEATETEDGMRIVPGPAKPTEVHTYDDHRMAMSFALFGLVDEGIVIRDPGCVAKTFPDYFEVLDSIRP